MGSTSGSTRNTMLRASCAMFRALLRPQSGRDDPRTVRGGQAPRRGSKTPGTGYRTGGVPGSCTGG